MVGRRSSLAEQRLNLNTQSGIGSRLVFTKGLESLGFKKLGMRVQRSEHSVDRAIDGSFRVDASGIVFFHKTQNVVEEPERLGVPPLWFLALLPR